MYVRGGLAFVYVASYICLVYKAANDHLTLPYNRYRLSFMFVKVQVLPAECSQRWLWSGWGSRLGAWGSADCHAPPPRGRGPGAPPCSPSR